MSHRLPLERPKVLARHLAAVQQHVTLLDQNLRQERQRRKDLQTFVRYTREELEQLVKHWRSDYLATQATCASELEQILRRRFL